VHRTEVVTVWGDKLQDESRDMQYQRGVNFRQSCQGRPPLRKCVLSKDLKEMKELVREELFRWREQLRDMLL